MGLMIGGARVPVAELQLEVMKGATNCAWRAN